MILGHLKSFLTLDQKDRRKIFEQAEILNLPARHTIFNQGDEGDKMYIILKGKVACEVKKKEYDNLSICVAIKNDGERFGELSHVDQDKLA